MGFAVGNKLSKYVRFIHLNGLEHVDITDADVRSGKISIDSKGNKIIGAAIERYIELYTDDATALSKDIDAGKTLYVKGKKITGSYTTQTISTVLNGRDASYTVASDNSISVGNFVKIVNGQNIGKVTSNDDVILGIAITAGSAGQTVTVRIANL